MCFDVALVCALMTAEHGSDCSADLVADRLVDAAGAHPVMEFISVDLCSYNRADSFPLILVSTCDEDKRGFSDALRWPFLCMTRLDASLYYSFRRVRPRPALSL